MNAIDVIIAVKDRAEIVVCVQSLLQIQTIRTIIICDGGSTDSDSQTALQLLEKYENVRLFHYPTSAFNKAWLLNQGILQAASDYVLITDADILWNASAVTALLDPVLLQPDTIYHIQSVQESQPHSSALQRDRYTYQIEQNAETALVEILLAKPQVHHRPGCGLICTQKETLLKLGGYKEIFQGWGWEDQDLLIRAQLLGVRVGESGEIIHLSHTDKKRNRYHNDLQPGQTRDRNIMTCLNSLAEGKLFGDLPVKAIDPPSLKQIVVKLPDSLSR